MFIDKTVKVTKTQRETIGKYDFEVTEEVGMYVITSPLVIERFGKAAGRDQAQPKEFDKLLTEMVERYERAQRQPTDLAEAKAVRPPKVLPAKQPAKPAAAALKTTASAKPVPAVAKPKTADWSPEFPDNKKIVIKAKECPRQPGTQGAEHWELYRNGMTIAQLRAAGGIRSKLKTDVARGNIALK